MYSCGRTEPSLSAMRAVMTDNLASLKDDMVAFIEGHGMRRFAGYVEEDVQSVMWDNNGNIEAWKDFVELAKASSAPFLTMNEAVLAKEDVDLLTERLRNGNYVNEEDVEEARWLRTYIGKTGFIQLGWPFQGVMFLFEVSTEWYDRYQRLVEVAEEFGGVSLDEFGADSDEEER